MLGDTHRVEDRGLAGCSKPLCRSDDVFCGNTGDLRDVLRAVGILHHDLFDLLEILGPVLDEVLVLPAVLEDLVHEAVQECHIGTGVELQVQVGLLPCRREPRVGVDDLCAIRLCLHNAAPDQRVLLERVGADNKEAL